MYVFVYLLSIFFVNLDVTRRLKMNLYKGLSDFRLCWKSTPNNGGSSTPVIAGRFSHSAVVHENSMYIFGGGSSTDTTFNDLWRFDLSKRKWIRPLSIGSYPSPKGSATMLCYNDHLILFGGWRYPSLHPPYQPWCLFDELHLYDIKENRWTAQTANGNGPPPMAGHSATIHQNKMIVFGGYQMANEINSNSSDVWCLNLDTFEWHKPEISNIKPPPRYGQFQIAINNTNLLIIGGCGGPNSMFNDAWLLSMSKDNIWQWQNIPIKNKKWSATHMWCNPACVVGSKLVVLGPTPNLPNDLQMIKQQQRSHSYIATNGGINNLLRINNQNLLRLDDNIPNQPRNNNNANYIQLNNNNNINMNNNNENNQPFEQHQQQQQNQNLIEDEAANRLQRNLALRCREDDVKLPKRFDEPFEDRFRMAAFNVHQPKSRNSSRERQLERVRRMEEKMIALRNSRRNGTNNSTNESSSSSSFHAASGADPTYNTVGPASSNGKKVQEQQQPSPKRTKRNLLAIYVCDMSNVLGNEPYLEWIEYKNYGIITGAPERLILSTIVHGNGELIMFGGVHKESLAEMTHQVSNSVHFLTAPRQII